MHSHPSSHSQRLSCNHCETTSMPASRQSHVVQRLPAGCACNFAFCGHRIVVAAIYLQCMTWALTSTHKSEQLSGLDRCRGEHSPQDRQLRTAVLSLRYLWVGGRGAYREGKSGRTWLNRGLQAQCVAHAMGMSYAYSLRHEQHRR